MKKAYEEISDEELKALTDAIKTKYGIDFTNYELKSLKRGFGRLITKNNFSSLLELWSNIIRSKEFMLGCIDELTVNLTELFRNPEIWEAIQHLILDRFSNQPTIRFWHAGCSTGEEIYTTAIMLDEINCLSKTKTLATDLSLQALEKAQKGEYSSILENKYNKSLQKYNSKISLNTYFNVGEHSFTVKPILQNHIVWKQHNLVTDGMVQSFDIIFCRNVMIYFDEVLKMNVLKLLFDSLNPNGLLIIGFYDSLPFESKKYFKSIDSKSKIYEKVGSEEAKIQFKNDDNAIDRLRNFIDQKK